MMEIIKKNKVDKMILHSFKKYLRIIRSIKKKIMRSDKFWRFSKLWISVGRRSGMGKMNELEISSGSLWWYLGSSRNVSEWSKMLMDDLRWFSKIIKMLIFDMIIMEESASHPLSLLEGAPQVLNIDPRSIWTLSDSMSNFPVRQLDHLKHWLTPSK